VHKALDRTYLALFREYPPLVRLAVITGAGQMAFALLNIYALPVYLNQDLHVSGLGIGGVMATFLLCETALKFPLGRLSDRWGRKPFIVLGPLLLCLNPLIIAWLPAQLWWVVYPIRAVDGIGAAALWPPLFAMVGDMVHNRSRAAAMSVMNTVYVGAVGAAAALGSFAAYLSGSNRSLFYLASAFLLISALTGYLGLPKTRAGEGGAAGVSTPLASADQEEPAEAGYPFSLILLISLLMTLGVLTLANFLILYVQVGLLLSPLETGLLLIALSVPVLILGLPLGHAADRWGKSRAVRVSLAVSAAAMWLIPFCRTPLTFGLVGVVLVAGHILGTPAWLALVSQLAPGSRRGGVMGIVASAEGVGAALGPLIGGWLWDWQPRFIFHGSAALLTAGALVAGYTLRRRPDWPA
jgi:MFS family permease